jgi:hypothetical protein
MDRIFYVHFTMSGSKALGEELNSLHIDTLPTAFPALISGAPDPAQ